MAVYLTRIKNNQITDQTITYQKLVPGTLVGTVFNPDVTLNSNIVINGNLSVSGVTTTVSSTNTLISDPLVIFNNGYSGADAYDVGMLINRGSASKNAAWIWRQANVGFAGVLTSEVGTTTGSINNYTYANMSIGNTIIDAYSVDSVDVNSGAFQVRGGAGISANLNVGGTATSFGASGGYSKINGNIAIVEIQQSLDQSSGRRFGLFVTDTTTDTGTLGVRVSPTGANILTVNGGTGSAGAGTTGGNDIFIQPGQKKSLWLAQSNAAVLIDNNINSTLANVGALNVTGSGGVFIGGNLNVGTSASFEAGRIVVAAPSAKANSIVLGGSTGGTLYTGIGAGVTVHGGGVGGTSIGDRSTIIGATAGNAAPGTDSTLIGYQAGGSVSGTNNTFVGTFAGNAVSTGSYNVILGSYDGNAIATLSNQVVVSDGQARPRIRIDAAGNVFVVSGLDSTSSNIGAFVVQGGAGIGGNLNVGGAAAFASGRVMLDATQTSIVLAGNTATTYTSTDSVFIGQKIGSGTAFGSKTTVVGSEAAKTNTNASEVTLYGYRAGYSGIGTLSTAVGSQAGLNATGTNNQFFGYAAGSASSFTGSYNVILGSNTGSAISSLSNYVIISDGQGNERIRTTNTGSVYIPANITSSSTSVGSLVVQGGIATAGLDNNFLGNVTIGGNLWVLGGTTAIQSNIMVVEDSTLQLHTFGDQRTLGANDLKDIGVLSHYYLTSDRQAFFGWQNSTSNFVYIDGATESSGNVISGTYGNVQFGSLWLSNTTASGSETTGALVVKGGIGAGALSYLNSVVVNNNVTASGTGAVIQMQPSGASATITMAVGSGGTTGSINNIEIGSIAGTPSVPATAYFKDLSVSAATSPQGRNVTFAGNGYVNIAPAGQANIAPSTAGNMDNMYVGNVTPRQAAFTAANIGQDLVMKAFSSNSVVFISQGNLSLDQNLENFNFQRTTGNTFSGISLNVGVNGDTQSGTDTLNIRYQGDSYTPQSITAANTVGQIAGWTVSTSRGTGPAPVINQDGDVIGIHGGYNYSGSTPAYQEAGSWRWVTQGTTGAASGIGGQAQLWTKRDNGASTLAVRVDANQISTFYGQVAIANTTTTTNSTTGALYVAGGISTSENMVVAKSARFNDTQNANSDFYVRGGNDATLIWANTLSSYNSVIIGNNASNATLVQSAKLLINTTDSMIPPKGTSGQRPGTAVGSGAAVTGMMRYNTTYNDLEYYVGDTNVGDAGWVRPQNVQGVTVFVDDQYNGDGNQLEFAMTRPASTNGTLVAVNGVVQLPSVSYSTFTGNAICRFTEAPAVGDVIEIRSIATTTTLTGLASPNGFVTINAENAGVRFTTGSTSANTVVTIQNNGAVQYNYPGNIAVGTSPTVIDSFDATSVRSAKYMVQVINNTSGTVSYETSEVMVIHNGATAYRTQYNRIVTGGILGNVTVAYSAGTVSLYYTGGGANNWVKVKADYLAL